jgi:hypothetical protein
LAAVFYTTKRILIIIFTIVNLLYQERSMKSKFIAIFIATCAPYQMGYAMGEDIEPAPLQATEQACLDSYAALAVFKQDPFDGNLDVDSKINLKEFQDAIHQAAVTTASYIVPLPVNDPKRATYGPKLLDLAKLENRVILMQTPAGRESLNKVRLEELAQKEKAGTEFRKSFRYVAGTAYLTFVAYLVCNAFSK